MDSVKFKTRSHFFQPVSTCMTLETCTRSGLQFDSCWGVKQTRTQRQNIWSDKITPPNPTSAYFNTFPRISDVRSSYALADFIGMIVCGTLMYSGPVTITMQWHLFRFTFTCPNKLLTFASKMHLPQCNWTRRYDFYVCADAWYHSWSVHASQANRIFTPIHNNKRQSSEKRRRYFSTHSSHTANP